MEVPLYDRSGTVVDHTLVSEVDYDWVMQWRWFRTSHGYAARGGEQRYLHREVLGLGADDAEVDHENGDKLDNRRTNLRLATRLQNARNFHGAKRNSKTGALGVFPGNGAYVAQVRVGGRPVHLGTYKTVEDASIVATTARLSLWGEDWRDQAD